MILLTPVERRQCGVEPCHDRSVCIPHLRLKSKSTAAFEVRIIGSPCRVKTGRSSAGPCLMPIVRYYFGSMMGQ